MNREFKPESKYRLEKRKLDGLKSLLKPSKSNEMMVTNQDNQKKQANNLTNNSINLSNDFSRQKHESQKLLLVAKNKSAENSFDKKLQGDKSAKLKTLKILLSDFKEQTKMRKLDKGDKGYKEKDYLSSLGNQSNVLKTKSNEKSISEINKKVNTSPVKPEASAYNVQLYDLSNSKAGKNESSFLEIKDSSRIKREAVLKKKNISSEFRPENQTPVSKKQVLLPSRKEKGEEECSTEVQHKRFQFSLKQDNIIYKNINSRLRLSIQEKSTELPEEAINRNKEQSNLMFEIKKKTPQATGGQSEKLLAVLNDSKATSYMQLEVTEQMDTTSSKDVRNENNQEEGRASRGKKGINNFMEESWAESKREDQSSLVHCKTMKFEYYFTKLFLFHRGDVKNSAQTLYKTHFQQIAKSYEIMSRSVPNANNFVLDKMVYFPPNIFKRKTLILDLDETLIHCNESIDEPYDKKIQIKFSDGDFTEAGINLRPHLEVFLRELNKYYEIVIFTASQSYYANEVLNIIDPSNELITFRLFREHCYVNEKGLLIKDLSIIKNRELSNIVIVDNASYSYGYHFENGIPIVPFFDDKADDELHHLMNYLLALAAVSDVRDFIKYDFCVDLFTKYASDSQLLLQRLAEIKKV